MSETLMALMKKGGSSGGNYEVQTGTLTGMVNGNTQTFTSAQGKSLVSFVIGAIDNSTTQSSKIGLFWSCDYPALQWLSRGFVNDVGASVNGVWVSSVSSDSITIAFRNSAYVDGTWKYIALFE